MQNSQAPTGIRMEKKSFLLSVVFIFLMMVAAYILTMIIPGGSYTRVPDADGNLVIDVNAGFQAGQGGLPFWKWLLSPLLVLGSDGSAALILKDFATNGEAGYVNGNDLYGIYYDGDLTIEREISGEEQIRDIVSAASFLKALLAES